MINKNKILIILIILSLFSNCKKENNLIKIGVAGPFTGDQAKIGQDMLNGVKLAVMDAKTIGGLAGYKLEVMSIDDQHNPSQAVSAAHKFVSDKDVLAVIGHLNSACTKPASIIYNQGGLLMITPASTNPAITQQGLKNIFRTCANDAVQGPAGADYIVKILKKTQVYVLDDKSTYGKGIADEFEKRAIADGAKILGHEGITQGEKDFSSILTKIKTLNPEVIFFGGMYPEGALLVKQSKNLGIETIFMGGDGLYDQTFITLATEPVAQGVLATTITTDVEKEPAAVSFVAAYKEKFGEPGPYSSYAYDAANIAIEAIKKTGRKDRQAVIEAVRNTKDYQGITGVTNFDERGDTTNKFIGIVKVVGSKWEHITKIGP